jgi:hypothetical protein
MPRRCSVCAHPESFEINEALVVEGRSNRAVATQYGLNREAIRRHKSHIPELLIQAGEDLERYESGAILRRIENLEKETLVQLEALKEDDDPDRRTILLAIREQRANIELVAKVHQLIDQAPQMNILVNNPRWVELRTVIVRALEPFPAAKQAISNALAELGQEGGRSNGHP